MLQQLLRPLTNRSAQFFFYTQRYNSTNNCQKDLPILKANFSKYNEIDKLRFKHSSCLITLSVGQSVHESEFLEATMELVSNHFKSCTFILGDTLQRFTLGLTEEYPEADLYDKAEQRGAAWLKSSISILAKAQIPWAITRWNTLINNKNFIFAHNTIKNNYKYDVDFHSCVEKNIDEFLSRLEKQKKYLVIDEMTARSMCRNYLLEGNRP